jgi:hypothetical protein
MPCSGSVYIVWRKPIRCYATQCSTNEDVSDCRYGDTGAARSRRKRCSGLCLLAVLSSVVCFASGTLIQVALRHPREQIRRNLPAGVITSVAVALWFLIG